ncbi:aromatic amino acid lyase, partial [Flavitalea antarctica]
MVILGGNQLTLNDFNNILFNQEKVSLDEAALLNVSENHSFLRRFSDHKLIYGINTGFGPMAQFKVSPENVLQLQYNLIRSHSSGGG